MKFNIIKMEDALDALIDYRGKTPKKSEDGIITLSAKSVKNNYIDYSQCYYISEEEYNKFMVRGFPKKGDVLITTEAPLGMVAQLDREDVAIAQRLLTLRGKKDVLLNEYLLYYLQSPMGQAALRERETGTTVTGIKQSEFRKIELKIPSYTIQRKISGLLKTISKKIEINNQINNNLFQQAQSIYKSWFIDFDPFDGNMPSNWSVGKVGDIIELYDSKRIPLSSRERAKRQGTYPYYGATSIMDYVDDYLFDGIYLLLGEDGTVADSNGYPILQYVDGKFWVNNHAHIMRGKNNFSVEMLYTLFSLTNVRSIITGAVQAKISQQNLKNVEIVIPAEKNLLEVDSILQPLFSEIRNRKAEIRKLTDLRDSLLPKLMSGAIDVSDINL